MSNTVTSFWESHVRVLILSNNMNRWNRLLRNQNVAVCYLSSAGPSIVLKLFEFIFGKNWSLLRKILRRYSESWAITPCEWCLRTMLVKEAVFKLRGYEVLVRFSFSCKVLSSIMYKNNRHSEESKCLLRECYSLFPLRSVWLSRL